MRAILFLTGTFYRNELRCNYLKNKKRFVYVFLHYGNIDQILTISKTMMTLIAYVITDCERRGYSNDLRVLFQKTLRQATC